MVEQIPEIDAAAIVLVGSFNPAIFHPEWFARWKLLPETEVDKAETKVVSPPVSVFETERFTVQVTPEKFVASSKPDTPSVPLRDLVLGTFFILEHTPATAMGLNRLMHFRMDSEESWHRIGDKLAPKDEWSRILEGRPGMRSLSILTKKSSAPAADLTVKVEPSLQIQYGVYFEVNESYATDKADKTPLNSLMKILKDRWEEGQSYAAKIAVHMVAWAGKSGD